MTITLEITFFPEKRVAFFNYPSTKNTFQKCFYSSFLCQSFSLISINKMLIRFMGDLHLGENIQEWSK